MPKKQHLEIFSRVGLCNPPFGFLCLTFHEMAEPLHEQSAMAMILNSNHPEPWQMAAWIAKKSLLRNPHKEHRMETGTPICYADRLWWV
jgi:hypothetical protein